MIPSGVILRRMIVDRMRIMLFCLTHAINNKSNDCHKNTLLIMYNINEVLGTKLYKDRWQSFRCRRK